MKSDLHQNKEMKREGAVLFSKKKKNDTEGSPIGEV